MLARIFRPTKSSMQSGRATTKDWVLEFEPASARKPDTLMGWSSTTDMDGQVRMVFEAQADAVAYAQAHGIAFELTPAKTRHLVVKAYADNFAYQRKAPWTH